MNKGLTLIEVILYIALFSIFIVVAIPVLINLQTWQSKQKTIADATQEFLFLEGKIQHILSEADSIQEPRPGQFTENLSVTAHGGERYQISNHHGLISIQKNNEELEPLHLDSVLTSSLLFYRSNLPGVNVLTFTAVINGLNFATTTYPIHHE